jgi:hypothetical protein
MACFFLYSGVSGLSSGRMPGYSTDELEVRQPRRRELRTRLGTEGLGARATVAGPIVPWLAFNFNGVVRRLDRSTSGDVREGKFRSASRKGTV